MTTCLYCRGGLKPRTVRHAIVQGSRVAVFSEVPAMVCGQCGEPFFAGCIVDEMNRFAWSLRETPGEQLSVHFHSLALPATA